MKKKIITALLIISLSGMTSCKDKTSYISYSEYKDIVKGETNGQKDIFIFTATNCPHCKKIKSSLNKYIKENKDVNIYQLNVDTTANFIGRTMFKDETMGMVTGDISDDNIKKLDNRIEEYLKETKAYLGYDSIVYKATSGYYSYVLTPLIIWYDSGLEVKLSNNVESQLTIDDKGNIEYDSFVNFMKYPETYPTWSKTFDL